MCVPQCLCGSQRITSVSWKEDHSPSIMWILGNQTQVISLSHLPLGGAVLEPMRGGAAEWQSMNPRARHGFNPVYHKQTNKNPTLMNCRVQK